MTWTGADLRASREALGVSMTELAFWLPWKQTRISECELDRRKVPEWVAEKMLELEELQDGIIEGMIASLENGEGNTIFVQKDAAEFLNEHPNGQPIHAAVHRTAAAIAVREFALVHGVRPHIEYTPTQS